MQLESANSDHVVTQKRGQVFLLFIPIVIFSIVLFSYFFLFGNSKSKPISDSLETSVLGVDSELDKGK